MVFTKQYDTRRPAIEYGKQGYHDSQSPERASGNALKM